MGAARIHQLQPNAANGGGIVESRSSILPTAETTVATTCIQKEVRYVIDTREKNPLVLPGAVKMKKAALKTGDYSIAGYTDLIAVEWKDVGDWSSWIGSDRNRFRSQTKRLLKLKRAAIVVGGPIGCISHLSPSTNRDSIAATIELAAMGLPVIHAPTRVAAGGLVKKFLDQAKADLDREMMQ